MKIELNKEGLSKYKEKNDTLSDLYQAIDPDNQVSN